MDLTHNVILDTDSYKASHWRQYPPGTNAAIAYIESRGGRHDRTVFFGLQPILTTLARPITHADVDEAAEILSSHGEPFNEAGWRDIVNRHGGALPIRIRAVPEGSVVPTGNALVVVESTDPEAFWLPSYLETALLRVWYPTTVATVSWHIKALIRGYLAATADTLDGLPFKLHDFGSRGVSSPESAALGGMAHLVNFLGTDTVAALRAARRFYAEPMAGFSIPATEHSTITAWQREGELDAYRHVLKLYGKPQALFACVSDSYDLWNAIDNHWGTALRDEVIASGATLVVRPDSGEPASVVLKAVSKLDRAFGSTLNTKGYRVLKHVRVIQGDGVNEHSIREILANLKMNGYSADNVAFGMGGGLLQQVHRDTQRFAMKTSAVRVGTEWRDVYKDPVTDHGKRSKSGNMALYRDERTGEYQTVRVPFEGGWEDRSVTPGAPWVNVMPTVFENGRIVRETTLAQARALAADALERHELPIPVV